MEENKVERQIEKQFIVTKFTDDAYEFSIPEGMPVLTLEDIQAEIDKLSPFDKDEIRKLAYVGASQGVIDTFRRYGLLKDVDQSEGNLSL